MGKGAKEPKETAEERELGRIAIERWNDYQIRLKPMEDAFIKDVRKTGADFDEARGAAATSVQQAFGEAGNKLEGNLFAAGLDPSSVNFNKATSGLSDDRALSAGTAINEAEFQVQNADLQGLNAVVQMGQGQAMGAIDGLGGVAARSTDNAINRANRSFANRQAGLNLVGTVAGAGASSYMNAGKPDLPANTGGLSEVTYNAHNDGSSLYDPSQQYS